ncbi:MAG: hypothetical protein ACRDJP_13970 [Actinomycetota bacterium]
MRRLAALLGTAIAFGFVLLTASPAAAHPLGNFTTNAGAVITITPGVLRIDYALDIAEIPTFQLTDEIDVDGAGGMDEVELATWAARRAVLLGRDLNAVANGEPVPLELASSAAALAPGEGGLSVLRLDARFEGPIPARGGIRFADRNELGAAGWREVAATGVEGMAVTASTVPTSSGSDHLRDYPEDLLSSPPDVRLAELTFAPGTQAGGPPPTGGGGERAPGASPLGTFVARSSLSPGIVALALLVALGVGAMHALAPGHGKTITAAYLAGSGARVPHAIRIGLAVAGMHTASVVALALVLVGARSAFPAERLYPWLSASAGAAAIALGLGLVVQRIRDRRAHDHGHRHTHPSRPRMAALALAGGLLPSPTAVLVLLGAFTVGRAGFGLALVAAFGLGLAASLVVVGAAAMGARTVLVRRVPPRVVAGLPIASAAAIAVLGAVVAAGGLTRL